MNLNLRSYKFKDINIFGSRLSIKKSNTIRLFCKNINRLPIVLPTQKLTRKYKRPKNLQRYFNVVVAGLIEVQINNALLKNKNHTILRECSIQSILSQ